MVISSNSLSVTQQAPWYINLLAKVFALHQKKTYKHLSTTFSHPTVPQNRHHRSSNFPGQQPDGHDCVSWTEWPLWQRHLYFLPIPCDTWAPHRVDYEAWWANGWASFQVGDLVLITDSVSLGFNSQAEDCLLGRKARGKIWLWPAIESALWKAAKGPAKCSCSKHLWSCSVSSGTRGYRISQYHQDQLIEEEEHFKRHFLWSHRHFILQL